MSSTNFPSTQPAFTMNIIIGAPFLVGSVSRGTPCTVVPIKSGTIRSEPGFDIEMDGSFVGTGNDYVHNDPDGMHMRLDAHAVVRSDDDFVYLKYSGVIEITQELRDILGGNPQSKTTDFGHSCAVGSIAQVIHIKFETGVQRLKDLETSLFIGAGRFIVDPDEGTLGVEYKISRVIAGGQSTSTSRPTGT